MMMITMMMMIIIMMNMNIVERSWFAEKCGNRKFRDKSCRIGDRSLCPYAWTTRHSQPTT